MAPLAFPLGTVIVYGANILIVVCWLIFSFLFWRGLRRWAIEEDKIFDLTFYATLVAFVLARTGFVVTHWGLFAGKSLLLIVALWVSPGLSWLGALIGGLATIVLLCRQYKVRLGLVLDTLAQALPLPIIVGEVASLMDGLEVGKLTKLPWAVHLLGHTGGRQPVQLYEMLAMLAVGFIMIKLISLATRQKWAYGIVGVWFLLLYSLSMFVLEFLKDSPVYLGRLTANQWILIGIFAECIGVLYVRGGGREYIRPIAYTVRTFIVEKGTKLYAKISRRNTR